MLKIKDSVDLKELENFGFEEYEEVYYFRNANKLRIAIDRIDRLLIVYINTFKPITCILDLQDKVFDLIQAGLIEKVEG